MDYDCERGAKRNFEPWREAKLAEETEEEMLDRLEKEEADRDAMKDLETKVLDAKQEMAIADALDEIRSRNARIERADKEGVKTDVPDVVDDRRKREEEEDAEAARKAFERITMPDIGEEPIEEDMVVDVPAVPQEPLFAPRQAKAKKDASAALGIKKKSSTPAPAPPPSVETVKAPASSLSMLVSGYGSDSD